MTVWVDEVHPGKWCGSSTGFRSLAEAKYHQVTRRWLRDNSPTWREFLKAGIDWRLRAADVLLDDAMWVCRCCMLDHANGECCPDDEHGGDGIAPWARIDLARHTVAMGLSPLDHHEECAEYLMGSPPANHECDCERREFSSSRCEGCGSWLAGERFGFSLWRTQQTFRKPSLPA